MVLNEASIAPLVVGGLLLLFGSLLYRVMLTLAGAVLGGAAGLGLGVLLENAFGVSGGGALALQAGGAVAGIIAGVAAFRLANAMGFFLFGAALGGWAFVEVFGLVNSERLGTDPDLVFAFGLPITAIICGLVMAALNKYMIALASALVGTLLVMAGLDWPLGGWPAPLLFVVGLAIQMRFLRRDDDEEDE